MLLLFTTAQKGWSS